MNKFSTTPTRTLLDKLGCPDNKLKIIHIAGTNGKGSTAEYFTQILISAGKKVGTFTSPEVYCFFDQIRIDRKPVTKELFEKYRVRSDEASEFEMLTATAISAFAGEGCEYAVIECGMGGLNDATNAIHKKELAVITSISLEHTEYLGNSIEEICAQKAGIIKNCPVVINAFQPSEAAKNYLKNIGSFAIPETLDGNPQTYNAATAIEGARILGIDERAIREGIKNTKPAGRVEEFKAGGRTYILDGAHNPAAFAPLTKFISGEATLIFGCLKDKDIYGNLSALAATCESIIAVPCPSPRSRTVEDVKNACTKYFKNVETAQSVADGLNKACTPTVVVCGSFTLLKEAKEWIEKRQ